MPIVQARFAEPDRYPQCFWLVEFSPNGNPKLVDFVGGGWASPEAAVLWQEKLKSRLLRELLTGKGEKQVAGC